MKKNISIILFICIIMISFLHRDDTVKANVFLQISSSSSGNFSNSSSGSISPILLNKNFAGIWSGKETFKISNDCITCIKPVTGCDEDEVLIAQSCTECPRCESSSSRKAVDLNKAALRKINLMLCFSEDTLQGVINSPGFINNAIISSQDIVNRNEVLITFEEDEVSKNATLQLIDNKSILVKFPNKQIFKTRKAEIVKNCNKITNPCKLLSIKINKLIEEANSCTSDIDCIAVKNQVCPFGCYNLSNINVDRGIIIENIANYVIQCESCTYKCSTLPSNNLLKCVNNKCVENK